MRRRKLRVTRARPGWWLVSVHEEWEQPRVITDSGDGVTAIALAGVINDFYGPVAEATA